GITAVIDSGDASVNGLCPDYFRIGGGQGKKNQVAGRNVGRWDPFHSLIGVWNLHSVIRQGTPTDLPEKAHIHHPVFLHLKVFGHLPSLLHLPIMLLSVVKSDRVKLIPLLPGDPHAGGAFQPATQDDNRFFLHVTPPFVMDPRSICAIANSVSLEEGVPPTSTSPIFAGAASQTRG